MEHVKTIVTFDNVRAVPPDPTRRSVGNRGVNDQWKAGGHPTISERHNQPGTALHTVEHPQEHLPEEVMKSLPCGPCFLLAMIRRALQKLLLALWPRLLSDCCLSGTLTWARYEVLMLSTRLPSMRTRAQMSVVVLCIGTDVSLAVLTKGCKLTATCWGRQRTCRI